MSEKASLTANKVLADLNNALTPELRNSAFQEAVVLYGSSPAQWSQLQSALKSDEGKAILSRLGLTPAMELLGAKDGQASGTAYLGFGDAKGAVLVDAKNDEFDAENGGKPAILDAGGQVRDLPSPWAEAKTSDDMGDQQNISSWLAELQRQAYPQTDTPINLAGCHIKGSGTAIGGSVNLTKGQIGKVTAIGVSDNLTKGQIGKGSRLVGSPQGDAPLNSTQDSGVFLPFKYWHNDPLAIGDFFNSPADGVDQVTYGDCFFESALESVASSTNGKQKIRDMIKQNNDGSYTVTFPGDKQHPVTVTDQELAKYNTEDDGGWADIIETAFLKLDKAKVNGGNDAIDSKRAPITSPTDAIKLLTGGTAYEYDINVLSLLFTSSSDLQNNIEQALKSGEAITTSSQPVPESDRMSGKYGIYCPALGSQYPIVGHHQFSVVGYDQKAQIITLQNPWGIDIQSGDLFKVGQVLGGITNNGDGKISMSFSTFEKYFTELDLERKSDPDHDIGIWNGYVPD